MPLYNDQILSQAVRRHLAWSAGVPDARIAVSASGAVVTLRGYVDTLVEWHLAQETARGVYGVRAVINEIDVRRRGTARVA